MSNVGLSTNEIASLWTGYTEHSLYVQFLKYLLATVEDTEAEELLQDSLTLSERMVGEIEQIFINENVPVPHGFTDNDVNLKAEKLFLDGFMIPFLEHTLMVGTLAHGTALLTSIRKDIRDFFTQSLDESTTLFNKTMDVGLEKGMIVRPPQITVQPGVEYVQSKKYLSAFGNRPLSTVELTHLFGNIKTNTMGQMLCMAFSQTTDSEEVGAFMNRGMQISQKHAQLFAKEIRQSNIDAPMGSNSYVTNATSRVFSDKLMMHFMSMLSSAGQGNYSTASTASMKYDLTLNYQRLSVEIALYAKDGVDIMIKNGWLEEPPQAPDRNTLSNK
ncbi:DUF3231 family protein [Tenuibacillus multivorans]|uniref:DUF3231 family protein n=1 Tax=Tenuibacillus multivorans TaxID=237069 RepID=A0A1H0G124_9BACI|nr:DUF3231 family protein [Tenuibacillus multivorans]GEL78131.1 hypothetical protein TMU01_23660 [Tenuibacillus multivorans]SDO00429.1 Protein of unknown function [Tenuibacillus multivorans]